STGDRAKEKDRQSAGQPGSFLRRPWPVRRRVENLQGNASARTGDRRQKLPGARPRQHWRRLFVQRRVRRCPHLLRTGTGASRRTESAEGDRGYAAQPGGNLDEGGTVR